ncbi:ASCH domain-containing protein [Chryseobacterium soli]|uniref:ASCH domain-containing protein n=1 Tax=Chryseobacterium soli TaxID=445961 RepID=UPI0029547D55|nr:ASCH domain-containing protein [Chryseobacterium soli]MDV7696282.1 ASCH domain-containing protein [Chryseobacterium soli]
MSILTLQIKKEFLDKILSGEKVEEYREIRPKNSTKYIEYFTTKDGEEDVKPRPYKTIQFFNGYKGHRPEVIVKIKAAEIEYIIDENENFIEYEENGEIFLTAQMVYTLGKVISKKNI